MLRLNTSALSIVRSRYGVVAAEGVADHAVLARLVGVRVFRVAVLVVVCRQSRAVAVLVPRRRLVGDERQGVEQI